jgi:uncharacterized membrane protein
MEDVAEQIEARHSKAGPRAVKEATGSSMKLARELILAFASLAVVGALAIGHLVLGHYYPTIGTAIDLALLSVVALSCGLAVWRWQRRRNSR